MGKELLAPAGSMECLKAAINNGADAVYLAGKSYGARKFAQNFDNEELIQAVEYAHIYGVKVYVTVNTIVYEEEMNDCLKYVEFLYNIGVDAIIVQDIGLIVRLREILPDMEIHASTQAHTHNLEQIKLLESLGVKRVVLAREMSLEEINNLDTNMELEIFIHGALCISYSGQCLFSSCVLNRSGNRGECAGLCRIPYNLYQDDKLIMKDKYLLSPKEFNSTNYIDEVKKSKAYSLKIEGRMKSPEYVGYVVSLYRKLLDNDDYVLSEEEVFNLKSLYNRGFTKGYLNNNSDEEFISLNSSNHLGVEIGEVIGFNRSKIKIKLKHEINQGDAIRLPNNEGMYVNFLYDEKEKLVNKRGSGEVCLVDNKVNLNNLGRVSLTINKKLIEELNNKEPKKIGINISVYMHVKEKLIVKYSDGKNEVTYIGDIVQKAKSMPVSREQIGDVLSKLGDTPFKVLNKDLDVDDDIFISIGVLKTIKRNLVGQLIEKRIGKKRNSNINLEEKRDVNKVNDKFYISALARNEEQVKSLLDANVDYIYVMSKELYDKYKSDKVFLRLDRVNSTLESFDNCNLLVGETGSVSYTSNNKVVSDYYLNVVNNSYIKYLFDKGIKRVTLSPELSVNKIKMLNNFNGELELIIYGTLEYMIMKYNFVNNLGLDRNNNYFLEDKSKRKFPIYSDRLTHLMGNKKIDLISEVRELKKSNVNVFRLELWDESAQDIRKIVDNLRLFLSKK